MTTTATAVSTGNVIGFNARRLRANLLRNEKAMQAFARLGIDAPLIEDLGLGIKEPYETSAGLLVEGVVTYPLEISVNRFRYGYLALDGITRNGDHDVAWNPGMPRTVRFGDGGDLLVVGSPMAVFQLRSVVERRGLAVAAVASSQPDRAPIEWEDPAFWAQWTRIIICEDVAAPIRSRIAGCAGRPIEIARGIEVRHGDEVRVHAVLDECVEDVLARAKPLALDPDAIWQRLGGRPGDFAAAPIALQGGIAGDRMYYPFRVERRAAGRGALMCSYETIVLRNDGTLLEAQTLPAPRGTTSDQRVHALTDGTRIVAPPQPRPHSTWSLDAIRAYVVDCGAGEDPCRRPIVEVLADVRSHVESRVALPNASDYWVVSSFVLLTHMFRVFDALPILLIEGDKGTGKSELAAAIASLAFNAATMGQGSAAALVRVARDCGGLVVLDDVECLQAGYGELSQCLKTGYRSSTAVKPITAHSGKVEMFDFFGPRLLTCTRGVDPVLGSRCIRISTAPGRPRPSHDEDGAMALRDELHAIGMSRFAAVSRVYRALMLGCSDRDGEIWAPLQAIAEYLGDDGAATDLQQSRDIQRS